MKRWSLGGVLLVVIGGSGCGVIGPSCMDEQGTILTSSGIIDAGQAATATVRSPKSSNLIMRLQWEPAEPRLGLRTTIIDCGGHVGCAMLTLTPASSPGGPGPGPHVWPPGHVEMLVDGWVGKAYRVEIAGVPDRDTSYRLEVLYRITCES